MEKDPFSQTKAGNDMNLSAAISTYKRPEELKRRFGSAVTYFSLHAKQKGLYCIVESRAGCPHLHGSGGRDGGHRTGYRESVNRRVIFRKLRGKGIGMMISFLAPPAV